MLKGAITAIVTPFKNGQFDEAAYRELIELQIKGGIHGIVPCGTTGESATLSHAEHKRVVETCIDQVKKRVVVIAGSGSNNTAEALELTQHAEAAGADAALMITPYYNKPTQEGLYQHYKTVASKTKIPIVVYNVPVPHQRQPAARNRGPAGGAPQYRGPQGCHRRPEAGRARPWSCAATRSPCSPGTTSPLLPLLAVGGRG